MKPTSSVQLGALLLLVLVAIRSTDAFVVCPSVTIQGSTSWQSLARIANCSVILGHVRIFNVKFEGFSLRDELIFPNLVEITDHLIIFQAGSVTSLERIFPKLAVIRGDKLFNGYALIIFFSNYLLQINLSNLVQIQRGSVWLTRLYHACYVTTVDWSYLMKDTGALKPKLTLLKNDCYMQKCRSTCSAQSSGLTTSTLLNQTSLAVASSTTSPNCWNDKDCQLKCPTRCANNCNLQNVGECCVDPLCSHCYNDSSCVSCSRFRDLATGRCVAECPNGTLVYESSACIRLEDCSRAPRSLVASYHVLEGRHCVRQCPSGFKAEPFTLVASTKRVNVSRCVQCPDSVCKRDCPYAFSLKTRADLDAIGKCVRVKRLHIQLSANVTQQRLAESLQYLEEIDEYLVVFGNRHLTSLGFLRRLRLIRGRELYENRFALFVHTNEFLRELWDYAATGFRLGAGTVKFFENPKLCFVEILRFIDQCNISSTDAEVSYSFNGYRRLTCSNRTIDLSFELRPRQIVVNWNVTIVDLRRLKGFTVSYIEAPDGLLFDQSDIDYKSSYNTGLSSVYFDWNHQYVQYNELLGLSDTNRLVQFVIDVEPFTRYAVYVKADITVDSKWDAKPSAFEADHLISRINYVYSLPSQPSPVESVVYEPVAYDTVDLKWRAPKKPNGVVQFFYVFYTSLNDWEQFPNDTDICQFVPSFRTGNELYSIGDQTSSSTSLSSLRNQSADSDRPEKKPSPALNSTQDEENNDLISIEDEIYNLAFRPTRTKMTESQQRHTFNLKSKSILPSWVRARIGAGPVGRFASKSFSDRRGGLNATRAQQERQAFVAAALKDLAKYYNVTSNLLRIVRQDLFIQEGQSVFALKLSNQTLNATVTNLTSFGRYIAAVVACQDFGKDLENFARRFDRELKAVAFQQYLSSFPVHGHCSKPAIITFRSLPDERLDRIPDASLEKRDGIWHFKWTRPPSPNGFVFKYNLRFVDKTGNKVLGPLCHALVDSLDVPLDSFLLNEGHTYLIQVQAITTAGAGPWSAQLVEYEVPNISQYYIKLILEILAAVVAIMVIVVIVCLVLRKYNVKLENGYLNIKSRYYYYKPDEWEIKREDVTIGERIGSGCFAEVHKGQVKLNTDEVVDCAIKFCGSDYLNRQRILKEANMMKSINTTHIVKLLGVVTKDNPVFLILEFMGKGDLKEYLLSVRNESFRADDERAALIAEAKFYRMAAEIADGMLWLSEHKYIHRDLAARNCLIANDDTIKIADLGLSKDIYQNPVYREKCKALLPIRWMSPESLINGSSTAKSDVWSYGVVLWEMCTYGENPYTDKENEQVVEFVKNGGRLVPPKNSPIKLSILIDKCMVSEDYKRVSFKEILDILEPDLESEFKQSSYYHNDFKKKLVKKKLEKEAGAGVAGPLTVALHQSSRNDTYSYN